MLFGVGIPYYTWIHKAVGLKIQRKTPTELRRLTDWYSWMERKRLCPADAA
jgi:hypothetical protein